MEKREKHIAVVLHGIVDPILYETIRTADMIIAADAAAIPLITRGIVPHISLGDFDSVTPDEKNIIMDAVSDVRIFDPEKDATDGELALRVAIEYRPDIISLYGATGGRIDHMLGIICLLEVCLDAGITAEVLDLQNRIWIMKSGIAHVKQDKEKPYISVIPISDTATVTLTGFLYPLTHKRLKRISTRGISNEICEGIGTIIIHTGKVLCVQSGDH